MRHNKANPKLFMSWKLLALSIDSLKGIIQNDVDLDEDLINEWCLRAGNLHIDLLNLTCETVGYISGESR